MIFYYFLFIFGCRIAIFGYDVLKLCKNTKNIADKQKNIRHFCTI